MNYIIQQFTVTSDNTGEINKASLFLSLPLLTARQYQG